MASQISTMDSMVVKQQVVQETHHNILFLSVIKGLIYL